MQRASTSLLACAVLALSCTNDAAGDDEFESFDATGSTSEGDGDSESSSESSTTDDESESTDATDTTDGPSSTTETTESTEGPDPVCGDGMVDDGEECDDGNALDVDGCTSDCVLAVCGDFLVQVGVEACDDGNTDAGDGCGPTCLIEGCGDGIQQGMEECDDGNVEDTDECTNLCVLAICGDSIVWAGEEECDDGDMDDTDECTSACSAAACGDGFVQDPEACDDGNLVDGDGCSAACTYEGSGCQGNPQWMPVDCSTNQWVWSSDRFNAPTLALANEQHVLWTGCPHGGVGNTCSLDGAGWVSTEVIGMAGCNATWYHLGGSYTGDCGGHDGDQVRRLALGPNDCYAY